MQARVLIKIRTIAIIVIIALVTSILYTLLTPHRAHALILDDLRDTTSSVIKQITNLGGTAPAPAVTTTPQAATPAPASTQPTSLSPQSTSTSNSPMASDAVVGETLPLMNADLQSTYFSTKNNNAQFASMGLSASQANGSSSSFVLLQATAEGWKFLNILWYWWAIAAGIISSAIIIWRRKTGQGSIIKSPIRQNTVYAE